MEELPIQGTPAWDGESRTKIDDLLASADSYINGLEQKLPADAQSVAQKLLEEFPEKMPSGIEDCQKFCDMITVELLKQYDEKMLGGFSRDTVKKTHDAQLCIPCFTQRPTEYPLYIQYLYCVRNPDEEHTAPYAEILAGAKNLSGPDREKLLYELRLRFIQDIIYGSFEAQAMNDLKTRGPEDFYKYILEPEKEETEEERHEKENIYREIVALAQEGNMPKDWEGEDYVYELERYANRANRFLSAAFYEAKLMRDLAANK